MSTTKDLVKNLIRSLGYFSLGGTSYAVDYILDYIKEELVKSNRVK